MGKGLYLRWLKARLALEKWLLWLLARMTAVKAKFGNVTVVQGHPIVSRVGMGWQSIGEMYA